MSAAPRQVKVFLSGEGSNELGSRFKPSAFQHDKEPGVLHVLLEQVQADGWEIGGARDWKSIRKFRVGGAKHADTHNVLGIAKDAADAGCEVLAFARDVDKDPDRELAIEAGIALVPRTLARPPEIIGGVAKPKLEGWILAVMGVRGTDALSPTRAEQDLVAHRVPSKDGRAMVEAVEREGLTKIPPDAVSLRTWLGRARDVLPRLVAERAGG